MTIAVYEGARAGVQSIARDQGKKPMSFFAFHDAGFDVFPRTVFRLIPYVSS
jgi:hypothetical protein